MNDVVVIGGGRAGRTIAEACAGAGLTVLVIDVGPAVHEVPGVTWIEGRGAVSGAGLVAILDPLTADERRLVPARCVVIAVGKPAVSAPTGRMLGITKLGAEISADGNSIVSDYKGRTRAAGIFATGSCASGPTPGIQEEIFRNCASSLTKG